MLRKGVYRFWRDEYNFRVDLFRYGCFPLGIVLCSILLDLLVLEKDSQFGRTLNSDSARIEHFSYFFIDQVRFAGICLEGHFEPCQYDGMVYCA